MWELADAIDFDLPYSPNPTAGSHGNAGVKPALSSWSSPSNDLSRSVSLVVLSAASIDASKRTSPRG